MRDEKAYTHLGYDSFDDYIEKAVPIKKRQELQSNAHLGITKLSLLASVSSVDRADIIENNDVEAISTREMRDMVLQLNQKEKQLSILETQLNQSSAELKYLQEENKQLKNAPVEVAVAEMPAEDVEKIRQEAEEKARNDSQFMYLLCIQHMLPIPILAKLLKTNIKGYIYDVPFFLPDYHHAFLFLRYGT